MRFDSKHAQTRTGLNNTTKTNLGNNADINFEQCQCSEGNNFSAPKQLCVVVVVVGVQVRKVWMFIRRARSKNCEAGIGNVKKKTKVNMDKRVRTRS